MVRQAKPIAPKNEYKSVNATESNTGTQMNLRPRIRPSSAVQANREESPISPPASDIKAPSSSTTHDTYIDQALTESWISQMEHPVEAESSVVHGSSFNEGDADDDHDNSAADFIQEDTSGDAEGIMDVLDKDEWIGKVDPKQQMSRPESAMRERPASATGQGMSFKWASIARLEPLSLPLMALFEPLARKLATGSIGTLIVYVEKGRPELCTDGLDSAVRAIAKIKTKDMDGLADTAYRLVVVGNFCGLLLIRDDKLGQATDVLRKVQMLTSNYTQDFKYKSVLRVWTMCVMSDLYRALKMPQVEFQYIESGVDHAEACKDAGGRLLCLITRSSFFCRQAQFEEALADVECADRTLKQMEQEMKSKGRELDGARLFRPFPKSVLTLVRTSVAYNAAVVNLCQEPMRAKEATESANIALTLLNNWLETSPVALECRRAVTLIEELLCGELNDRVIKQVRAATMKPPMELSTPADAHAAGVGGRSTRKRRCTSAARSRPTSSTGRATPSQQAPSIDDDNDVSSHEHQEHVSESSSVPWNRGAQDEEGARLLLTALFHATIFKSVDLQEQERKEMQALVQQAQKDVRASISKVYSEDDTISQDLLGEVPANIRDMCHRHLRGAWLHHSPVLAVHISQALSDFLRALDQLFLRGKYALILAHVERLMGGIHLPAVSEALGLSSDRDVCVCITLACASFGAACLRDKSNDDALAFFGVSLALCQRASLSGSATLLRAWVFDLVAQCYYIAGEYQQALSLLETARVACGERNDADLALHEMRIAIMAHMLELHLKVRNDVAALEVSLDLMLILREASRLLFKYDLPPRLSLGLEQAAGQCAVMEAAMMHRLESSESTRREMMLMNTYAFEEDDDAGHRFGEVNMAMWVPCVHESQDKKKLVGRVGVHSLRYVTAHVAFGSACASAGLGKFADALSLIKFAEVNGRRAGEHGWDNEGGYSALVKRVKEGREVLMYIMREGNTVDASVFGKVFAEGGGAEHFEKLLKASNMSDKDVIPLVRPASLRAPVSAEYRALCEVITSNAQQAAESRARARPMIRARRPASASSAQTTAMDPLASRLRQRPASAIGVHRASAASGTMEGRGSTVQDAPAQKRRPASALGVGRYVSTMGTLAEELGEHRVTRDALASKTVGGRLRPASARA